MERFKSYRWLLLLFALFLLSSHESGAQWLQQPTIVHKEGIYYNGLMPNGMQKTHEVRSVVYALPTSAKVTLKVPPQRKDDAAPHGYYRWYMYETDNLVKQDLITTDVTATVATNGKYYLENNKLEAQRAYYDFASGGKKVVACDVSAYTDYKEIGASGILEEPTLSYRCIFDIRPASEIAGKLRALTSAGEYLEDKVVYMPKWSKLANRKQKPRVTLDYDRSNYFIYTTSTGQDMVSGSDSKIIKWTINSTNGVSTDDSKDRFVFIDSQNATSDISVITVKLKVNNSSPEYNVARFTIIFTEGPKEFSRINSSEYRSLNYLESNYVLVNKLDFDYDTEPATAANNISNTPLPWNNSSYGFASPALFDSNKKPSGGNKVAQWAEYGFYKTANEFKGKNIEWYNDGKVVRDRLYDLSGGKKNGYFMYIDASDMPGVIATLPMQPLCAGTRLFVSAGVASLTSTTNADAYPDINLVFLGIDGNGKEVELNRYSSGDIPGNGSNNPTPWHQLYYTFTFAETDGGYSSYKLRLENNCTSTSGGDYAVDDIRVYRSKPAVRARQVTLACDAEVPKVKIQVELEKLLSALGVEEVTGNEKGTPVVVKYKFLGPDSVAVQNYNYGKGTEYGTIKIYPNFSAMTVAGDDEDLPVANGDDDVFAYTETEKVAGITYRYIVFQTPNNEILKQNKSYHTVIANQMGYFETGLCSMISDPFIIQPPARITVDGSVWKEGDGLCYGNSFILGAKLLDRLTQEEVVCRFDWFIGSAEELQDDTNGLSIERALKIYRAEYPVPAPADSVYLRELKGSFTATERDRLFPLVENGQLLLNRHTIIRIVRYGENILAIPITGTASNASASLCEDFLSIRAGEPHKNPAIEWLDGFGDSPLSLRMGLEQWKQLENDNTKSLKVPVGDFVNSDGTKIRELVKADDTWLYLLATDVPNADIDSTQRGYKIGNIKEIHIQDNSENYIVIENLTVPKGLPIDLIREGYTYKTEFLFNQKKLNEDVLACDGTAILIIKIVPEYQTWTGEIGDNWNNDQNWKRSTVDELFKTATNSDGYEDYSLPYKHKGFVPMGFTKVTIPASAPAFPWLYKLPLTSGGFKDMDNINYDPAMLSEGEKLAHSATAGIEYEMEVNSAGTPYLAELFTGNRAGQVFVRHGAEIRNTDPLSYEQAWIDFELDFSRWYLLASPLQGVVAGDFYLPGLNGRQETESFRPIYYDTRLNNRFYPAVWQRSWNKDRSYIYEKTGNMEDAFITEYVDWSLVYNKVEERYDPGNGFSIKPDSISNNKVLFRLPKADTQYEYYSYDNPYAGGTNTAITRVKPGKFQLVGSVFEVAIENKTAGNNLFLVGNPFMSSMDMEMFFNVNPSLEKKYWILSAEGQGAAVFDSNTNNLVADVSGAGRYIAPLQGFFVKGTSSAHSVVVKFTPEMTTSENAGVSLRSARIESRAATGASLSVSAEQNGFRSKILIIKQGNADNGYQKTEDVELLLDSDQEGVPALYSVAGDRAAVINVVANPKSIPLGVYGNEDAPVNLSFEGMDSYGSDVSLYNLDTGVDIPLRGDSASIPVRANSHARYILRFAADDIGEELSPGISAYSPEKGKIVVTTDPDDELQSVRIYDFEGRLITGGDVSNPAWMEYHVRQGIYIVHAKSKLNNKTIKVLTY